MSDQKVEQVGAIPNRQTTLKIRVISGFEQEK